MPINSVKSIGMTVADLDRSIDFYTTILPFTKIAVGEASPAENRQISGEGVTAESSLPADRLSDSIDRHQRVVLLQLGNETIELTEFPTSQGRPIPPDSRSHDRWFQHLAIVVTDMERAYQHLRQHAVVQTSPSPQTLPAWNPVAGGIQAFYFRDPDGHNLELIHFPTAKTAPKWQHSTDALFLGIDHTAIVVANTAASRAFYCDLLGMELKRESENFGVEQERLSGVDHAKVRISSLAAPTGIGIELLEYLEPTDGRSIPTDTEFNDIWCWQTQIVVTGVMELIEQLHPSQFSLAAGKVSPADRQFCVRDPDGHTIFLIDR
jgi:catechol 2,3-dioxygenase-like lactoylglutathione lyase family enzyme